MCSLFIGLNYPFYRVYNIALQLLQYILGIFHYLSFVSGAILLHRPQVMGLHDWPAHRASRFGLGPLPLASASGSAEAAGLRPPRNADLPLGSPPQRSETVQERPRSPRAPSSGFLHMVGQRRDRLVLWWGDPRPAGQRCLRVDRAETA